MSATPSTIGDVVRRQARERPDAPALSDQGRTTTWRELDRASSQVANGLLARQGRDGPPVAFLGKNCDRFFEVLYGAAKAGGTVVPLNWRLTPSELDAILTDAGAECLFVTEEFVAVARELAATDRRREDIVVGDERWRAGWAGTDPEADQPEVPVLLVYTSGTTGQPKGAMLSHRYLFEGLRLARACPVPHMVWKPDETVLVSLPLFHVGGIAYSFAGSAQGCRLLLLREFSPPAVLAAIDENPIPTVAMVPTMVQMVLDHPACASTNFSNLRYLWYGAAPMPQGLLNRAMDVMGCEFVQTYGMTENTYLTCLEPQDHSDAGRRLSVGRPFPDVLIRILDGEGKDVPTGEFGEVTVRCPAVMDGYWRNPEATAASFHDGWFRTGDGGYLDGDGFLFLTDRISDMIVSGGENVYPAEVEEALRSHPHVLDVAVVGVSDDRWGEVPKAFVMVTAGTVLDGEALKEHAAARLAGYKVPKHYEMVHALPRTASGKVLRRELRDR